ncbi:MAG: hypothetical protein Q7R78_02730 [bacterium]|nr:hypothetical protein [bacterium]
MEPNETGMKPWQWGITVLVIVIVLALIGYFVFRGPSTTGTDDQNPVTQNQNTNELNRIIISDQFPGNRVYVSTVQLGSAGFVVIHKDNAGAPGAVIGYAWMDKGVAPLTVDLTESTVDGGVYYAMLHTDAGSDKAFDIAKDLPIRDSKGGIVMKMFKALLDIPEFKG